MNVQVAVSGYGVIGKRVADAVRATARTLAALAPHTSGAVGGLPVEDPFAGLLDEIDEEEKK